MNPPVPPKGMTGFPPMPPSMRPQEAIRQAKATPIPEQDSTLQIQLQQLQQGKRRAVMFPKGTKPPASARAIGMARLDTKFGVFFYNPSKLSASDIRRAIQQNQIASILGDTNLGYGAPDKSQLSGEPKSVVSRDPKGKVVQGVMTDAAHEPQTIQAAKAVTPKGGEVAIETPQETVTDRMQDDLSPAQAVMKDRSMAFAQQNLPQLVQQYLQKFGTVLTTANARELFPEYSQSEAAKSQFADALTDPARLICNAAYTQILKQPDPKGLNDIVITAGGTGSGKTTALPRTPDGIVDHAQAVLESHLDNLPDAARQIDQGVQAGKNVTIVFIERDPMDAMVNGTLPRAEESGRTVGIDKHLETHAQARPNFLALQKQFAGNPQVHFELIDNSNGPGKAAIKNPQHVRMVPPPEAMKPQFVQALKGAKKAGIISSQTEAGSTNA